MANAVAVLNDTTIWIASNNSQIAIWNGNKQTGIMCLPVSVSKMWAENKNWVYTVGALGQIGHYTNGNWQKIESGTTSQIYDIWGLENPKYEDVIYCCVLDNLLKINQQNEVSQFKLPNYIYFWSVWFDSPYKLYGSGNGIYENSNNKWNRIDLLGDRAVSKIRGTDYNNIFGAGTYGLITHFNGSSWYAYNITKSAQGAYTNLSVKDRIMIAVGFNNGKAIITIGKRN